MDSKKVMVIRCEASQLFRILNIVIDFKHDKLEIEIEIDSGKLRVKIKSTKDVLNIIKKRIENENRTSS